MQDNTGSRLWDAFIKLESRHKLCSLTAGGVPYWDYVRFFVYARILEAGNYTNAIPLQKAASKANKKTVAERSLRLLRRMYHAVRYAPIYYRHYEYIFIGAGNSRRVPDAKNQYMDIWCDPVMDYLGTDRCLLLETFDLALGKAKRPLASRHVISSEQMSLSINLLGRKVPPIVIQDNDKSRLDMIGKELSAQFGISMDLLSFLPNILAQERLSWAFGRILEKVKPKAVFVVCSYGKEGYISACKKNNIPVIELQHGVMTNHHAGYAYPGEANKKLFPDYFFSFGDYWNKDAELPIPGENNFVMGYPYLSAKTRQYLGTEKRRQILFISQWTIGKELSVFASALKKRVPADWKVIYKLHPAEVKNWQENYAWLASAGVDVVADNNAPLYQLMAESSVQVGVYSTAIFEGLMFGCETYLVELPGIENMQNLLKGGYAKLVHSPEQVDIDSLPDAMPDCSEIFAGNWQSNLDMALARCLKV